MRHLVLAMVVLVGGRAAHTAAEEPTKDDKAATRRGPSPNRQADEPAQEDKSFEVPAPRPVPADYLPYQLPSSLPQPGTREIWQYYGVDGRGRWRPRVILAPTGAYYYHNGASFYYTTTQPRLYMPYVVD